MLVTEDLVGARALACAVIALAVKDVCSGSATFSSSAAAFLREDCEGLKFWAALAGIDHQAIVEGTRRQLKTRARRRRHRTVRRRRADIAASHGRPPAAARAPRAYS